MQLEELDFSENQICNCLETFQPEVNSWKDDYHYPNASGIFLVRSLLPKILDRSISVHKKIFVSRNIETSSNRLLIDSKSVEDALKNNGFECISPEKLTFIEQVNLFRNAKIVVGVHGSGLFNCVFMDSDTSVIEIAPSADYRWGVISISEVCSINILLFGLKVLTQSF